MKPHPAEPQTTVADAPAAARTAGTTVCLCMIVRNEDHVIRRCLASVLPWITHWLIVDTGSTDGTQATIQSFMEQHRVPGELFERSWVDFAHNRSESLALAAHRAEYLLVIDADEYLEADPGFVMPRLSADVYSFELISGPFAYPKMQLLRANAGWRYVGVIHEHLSMDRQYSEERLQGLRTIRVMDGARARDPMTFRRDALLLEQALLQEPENSRHMFYLAQSYADAKETHLAIDRYQKRVDLGGWDQEVWCSMYQIAKLRQLQGDLWPAVQQAYLEAFSVRPTRAEPLFRVGAHYQSKREFALAHLFLSRAMTIPYPAEELLYVEREIYRYFLPLEYAVACFYVGRHEEAIRTANHLLADPDLAPEQRDQVIRNRQYSLDALLPPQPDPWPEDTPESPAEAGVLVVVLCDQPDSWLAPCIQSLISQNRHFRAIVIEREEAQRSTLQAALDGTPFISRQAAAHATWAECLLIAAAEAKPGEILLPLSSGAVLADKRCIADLVHHFNRYGCTLMYGQFRWLDGSLGDAMPFASPGDLEADDLASPQCTLAFRKELLDGQPLPYTAQPLALMRRAGYDRIRFSDRPFALHLR